MQSHDIAIIRDLTEDSVVAVFVHNQHSERVMNQLLDEPKWNDVEPGLRCCAATLCPDCVREIAAKAGEAGLVVYVQDGVPIL
jgi:hypothetical protein